MAALPGYTSPEPTAAPMTTTEKMPLQEALNADPAEVKAAESRNGTAPASVVGTESAHDHHAGAGPALAGVAGAAGGAGLAHELSSSEHQQQRPNLANDEISRSYIKPSPVIANGSQVGSAPTLPARSEVGSVAGDRTNTASPVPTNNTHGTHGILNGGVNHPDQHNNNPEQQNHDYAKTAGAAGVGAGTGLAIGQFVHPQQHQQLQQQAQPSAQRGQVLIDDGVVSAPGAPENTSPVSPYGARPNPDSPTAHTRPLSRAGTLQRGANGGTIGRRTGTFGRGAGASVGTQPEEVMGRDDIHTRVENNERGLDEVTLKKLQAMEGKDAKRLTKVLKKEGKEEAKSVAAAIKELERLGAIQKEAAKYERKAQLVLSKYTAKEHKAKLRWLKEQERYAKVESALRNAEEDYEAKREHAGQTTATIAEKTQELDDLRANKAADDREREQKILALKTPGHA